MPNRVALITGGAKGIAQGIALDLGAQQWLVAICYRTSEQDAQHTKQAIEKAGGQAMAIRCDVSDPTAVQKLVYQVESTWGQIDVLINGAGPYHRVHLFEETPAGWAEMIHNNLDPVLYLAQAVAPGMRTRQYGRIISFGMANVDKMEAQPHVTAHYIAKAGVVILTKTLAKMLAPDGITVNAISPGYIDSGSSPPSELDGIEKNIPAGYIGEIADIVSAVRYLLSDEARYVTGANLQVGGGWGI
ncbi:MAG: beta-ketoacyl-ACP reductase [Nitrospirales bacterium]|nr:MAG: beta-ketoacyl-ACP reductase [Nitrospirales bacterium]